MTEPQATGQSEARSDAQPDPRPEPAAFSLPGQSARAGGRRASGLGGMREVISAELAEYRRANPRA